jgi:hypothetical protein
MSLKNNLRKVFRNEGTLYDLGTTDTDKTIEFAKGDFRRFSGGGPVQYGNTSAYYKPAPSIPTETSDYTRYAAQKPNLQKPTGFLGVPDNESSAYYRLPAPKAPRTLQGSNVSSGYYGTDFGRKKPSFAPKETPSIAERLKGFAKNLSESEAVNNFINNLRKKFDEGDLTGAPVDPQEFMNKFRPSGIRARVVPGARFSKGEANTPVTNQFAKAFDPRLNSAMAKFLMANMGTSGVSVKGLPLIAEKIAVRKPKYYNSTNLPQTVTFKLPA